MLSIMGRVQLVNSLLSNMLVYSFHIYNWPDSLSNHLNISVRSFVWSGDFTQRKLCTVAWKDVCKDREELGLAVKEFALMNKASLLHLCCQFLTSSDIWAVMCRNIFLKHAKPRVSHLSSSIWHSLKPHISTIFLNSTWVIGNGESIHFWTDKWLNSPIVGLWGIPEHLHSILSMKLAAFIWKGRWNIPHYFLDKDPSHHQQIMSLPLPIVPALDTLVWTHSLDGTFTNKLAYNYLNGTFLRLL